MPSGMVRAVMTLLSLAYLAHAQISPGPLSRAHQDLEGPTKCSSCHNFGLGASGFKCFNCHTEIQRRVDAKQGYHARGFNVSRGQLDCARCHVEHNGRQFAITKLDRTTFKHDSLTDFPLLGKHRTLSCETCHNPQRILVSVRPEIKVKSLDKTYLGLPVECASCHKDAHAGQLGPQCKNCHSQDAWKPAAAFDHSRTAYPLTGRHQSLECAKCHVPAGGGAATRYKGLSFASCQGCHIDPHRGAFQVATSRGTCESCHSTLGWKTVRSDSGFDHQKTKFPLNGKHADLTCFQCHKSSDFRQPVEHEKCGSCHEDIHQGQFANRTAGSDCASCHTETSFKPSLFTRESHQKSAFQLEGKHAPMECAKCHKPEGKEARYMLGSTTCQSCHKDPHSGQFAAAPFTDRCEQCHAQDDFQPSTFTMARHAQTKFALTGAHAAVICADCHHTLPNAASGAARQYHFPSQTCTECHTDPHRTSLACETCHNVRQWKELRQFDHNSTKFPLEGAHQTASCIGCHRPLTPPVAAKAKPTADFAQTFRKCHECHEDIHGGQFMTADKEEDCSTCHSISKWGAGSFDHGKTRFVLDGAHSKVRCAQCHTQLVEREGRQVRLYRGTPAQCTGCHMDTK